MTEAEIQIARDCAAIVEIVKLQAMLGLPDRQSVGDCCREIVRSINKQWPEAFVEPPAPQLRKVEEHERNKR